MRSKADKTNNFTRGILVDLFVEQSREEMKEIEREEEIGNS